MTKNNKIEITADGSHSIFSEKFQALYHSKHGAIQESQHVFIDSGLKYLEKQQVNILEMGFGTGLNALLTYIYAAESGLKIYYETIEAYPIKMEKVRALNYLDQLNRKDLTKIFHDMHNSEWNEAHTFDDFTLRKVQAKIQEASFSGQFDLVYYDAFAPLTQEELWTPEIFKKIASYLNPNAVLVSYCCKGSFKRALNASGFTIEKIPGPPGKREMIRATFRT
ncbi:tRNA (5-methylaminomethyl-2-thiouridine)(34)-methyltransferase MnmD [Portibacter marinus]|uniref:tRNA (5-methylaminomethyl-2-thiouridine)(34)-methyltransferase MnmD n=1 Tax=Portibacter marinus TaxID=2898660 RepID=UPI001F3F28A0|nr:tRNA (5-methylaminomethyl-2-thiouridine)(34)-methyltransferase MnmD [Portibacter marinus]